jgi:hypothetical protein
MRISPAWSSLLFGLVAALVAAGTLGGTGFVGISWLGILAVVLGVRALRLRASGHTRARIPAVIGLVSGGLATLVMIGSVATYALHSGTAASTSAQQWGTAPSDVSGPMSSAPAARPDPTGTAPSADTEPLGTRPPTTLEAEPRSPLPDDALDQYRSVTVRSTTAAAAGCGVVSVEPEAVPLDHEARTQRRLRQDYLSLQLQEITAPIRNDVKTSRAWPKGLDLDPETGTVFLPAPTCTPLGVLPKGVELRFGVSPDHGQIAIAVWDPTQQVGSLWRSVDDTLYQL